MKNITKIFDFLNKNVIYVLLGIIGVLLIIMMMGRTGKKNLNDNLIITKDSVSYYKNKANQLVAQVNTFIITEKQLKTANGELYNEVNNLKRQKPLVTTKEVVKISYRDTTITTSISELLDKNGNKLFNISLSKDTIFSASNYIKFEGKSYIKIDSTLKVLDHGASIQNLNIGVKLFLSYTEDNKGKLKINARSDFPGLTFQDIEGYIIDPMSISQIKKLAPKKRYGVSAFGGVGTYFNGGGIKFIPTVGVGITYDFLRF